MGKILRELGAMEKLFELFHNFTAQLVVYTAHISGKIDLECLQQAIADTQKQQALLRVHITHQENKFFFQHISDKQIPLTILPSHSSLTWADRASQELNIAFQPNQPLCRICLLQGEPNVLLITLHHAIADGLSGILVIESILENYRNILLQKPHQQRQTQLQVIPAVEDLVGSQLSILKKATYLVGLLQRFIYPADLLVEELANYSDREVGILTQFFSEEQTETLVRKCRQEQTTVQGALCASLLMSLGEHFPDRKKLRFTCNSFVNLRPDCSRNDLSRQIGCLSSGLEATHILTHKTKFWDLARESKKTIEKRIARRDPQDHILLVNWLKINSKFLNKISNQRGGRTAAASVSNCGRLKLDDTYGDLQLQQLHFFIGQHFMGASIWLSAITFNNQLMLGLGHANPVVSKKTAEMVAQSISKQLQYCC